MTCNRQERKLRGPDWTCWCCRLSMPSAAFDAEWPKQANIFDNYLSPGHWRRCKACDEAIGLARELNQANETVRCGSCNMHQIPELFAEGNRTCYACLLRDTFRLFCCYKCKNGKKYFKSSTPRPYIAVSHVHNQKTVSFIAQYAKILNQPKTFVVIQDRCESKLCVDANRAPSATCVRKLSKTLKDLSVTVEPV